MIQQDESDLEASHREESLGVEFARKEGRLPAAILHVIAIERKRATKVYRRGLNHASVRVFRLKACSRAFFEWKVLIFMKKSMAALPTQGPDLYHISHQIFSLVADAQSILSGFAEGIHQESSLVENSPSSSYDRTMYFQVKTPDMHPSMSKNESLLGGIHRTFDPIVRKEISEENSQPLPEDLHEDFPTCDLKGYHPNQTNRSITQMDLHCIEGDLMYIIFQLTDCKDLVRFVTESISLCHFTDLYENEMRHHVVQRKDEKTYFSLATPPNLSHVQGSHLPDFAVISDETISKTAQDCDKTHTNVDHLTESQFRFFMTEIERKDREIIGLQTDLRAKENRMRLLNEEVQRTKEVMDGKNVFFTKKFEAMKLEISKQAEKLMQKYEEIEVFNQALKAEENNSRSIQSMLEEALQNTTNLERKMKEDNAKASKAVQDLNCRLEEEKRKVREMMSNLIIEREVSFRSIMLCRKAAEEISLLMGELMDVDNLCCNIKRGISKDQEKLEVLSDVSGSVFEQLERLEWSMDKFSTRISGMRSREKMKDLERGSLKLRIDHQLASLHEKDSQIMALLQDLSSSKAQIEKMSVA